MRNIYELHHKHDGEIATVLANGPTLFKFIESVTDANGPIPPDLVSSVWVGINYSYKKVGKDSVKYLFLGELETYNIIKEEIDNSKMIIPIEPGLNKHKTADRVKVNNSEAYGYVLQDPLKNKKIDLPNKYYGIDKDAHFFSYTTTTQTAIHILCYMGFKKIYLVGVDYRLHDSGKVHFEVVNDKQYSDQPWNAFVRFREGDNYLIPKLCAAHGVKIINIGEVL
jgi:hypothetical protein